MKSKHNVLLSLGTLCALVPSILTGQQAGQTLQAGNGYRKAAQSLSLKSVRQTPHTKPAGALIDRRP